MGPTFLPRWLLSLAGSASTLCQIVGDFFRITPCSAPTFYRSAAIFSGSSATFFVSVPTFSGWVSYFAEVLFGSDSTVRARRGACHFFWLAPTFLARGDDFFRLVGYLSWLVWRRLFSDCWRIFQRSYGIGADFALTRHDFSWLAVPFFLSRKLVISAGRHFFLAAVDFCLFVADFFF